jgi:hypothetical protein
MPLVLGPGAPGRVQWYTHLCVRSSEARRSPATLQSHVVMAACQAAHACCHMHGKETCLVTVVASASAIFALEGRRTANSEPPPACRTHVRRCPGGAAERGGRGAQPVVSGNSHTPAVRTGQACTSLYAGSSVQCTGPRPRGPAWSCNSFTRRHTYAHYVL